MAKGRVSYEFLKGDQYTDVVKAVYCHVNKPDTDYDKYSITVVLPSKAESTQELMRKTLEFENEQRQAVGLPTVTTPSNWLRKGQPRLNDDGDWELVVLMNTTNNKGTAQQPAIFDVYGNESDSIQIWSGDMVVVNFSIAVWTGNGDAGSKYFLKAVQQIRPNPDRPEQGKPRFKDHSGDGTISNVTSKPEEATVDSNDVPF